MKCCDLAIGLAGNAPPSAPSSSYGLLWADPARVDGGFEGNGGRLEEDVSGVLVHAFIFPLPIKTVQNSRANTTHSNIAPSL